MITTSNKSERGNRFKGSCNITKATEVVFILKWSKKLPPFLCSDLLLQDVNPVSWFMSLNIGIYSIHVFAFFLSKDLNLHLSNHKSTSAINLRIKLIQVIVNLIFMSLWISWIHSQYVGNHFMLCCLISWILSCIDKFIDSFFARVVNLKTTSLIPKYFVQCNHSLLNYLDTESSSWQKSW